MIERGRSVNQQETGRFAMERLEIVDSNAPRDPALTPLPE
jgi:hypothetical protein